MAVNTAGTILKYSTDGLLFNELCPIISYPDMGSTPTKIDITDLSALKFKKSMLGLQEVPDLTFEANYDKTAYTTISALNATYTFNLEFGDAGADGIFEWEGQIQIYANGGAPDEARKMTLTCSAETEITMK